MFPLKGTEPVVRNYIEVRLSWQCCDGRFSGTMITFRTPFLTETARYPTVISVSSSSLTGW